MLSSDQQALGGPSRSRCDCSSHSQLSALRWSVPFPCPPTPCGRKHSRTAPVGTSQEPRIVGAICHSSDVICPLMTQQGGSPGCAGRKVGKNWPCEVRALQNTEDARPAVVAGTLVTPDRCGEPRGTPSSRRTRWSSGQSMSGVRELVSANHSG